MILIVELKAYESVYSIKQQSLKVQFESDS